MKLFIFIKGLRRSTNRENGLVLTFISLFLLQHRRPGHDLRRDERGLRGVQGQGRLRDGGPGHQQPRLRTRHGRRQVSQSLRIFFFVALFLTSYP